MHTSLRSAPRRTAVVAVGLLLVAVATAIADTYPAHETFVVPMSDGTVLHTEVFLPSDGQDPWPVVLFRTPYDASGWDMSWYTDRGYVGVAQDIRGFFGSGGTFRLFRDDGWGPDHRDGLDTVEWVRAQPWCDGHVASEGNSALGITQNMLAGSLAPGVTCQYVGVAPADPYLHAIFPGGAFRRADIVNWLTIVGYPGLVDTVATHATDDPWWDWVDVRTRYAQIALPTYQLAGWYDVFLQGNLDVFAGLQSGGASGAAGNQKLVVGPWTHEYAAPPDGQLSYPDVGLATPASLVGTKEEWFDHWQNGAANGILSKAPVAYYVMGDPSGGPGNEWRAAWSWPPPAVTVDYYLRTDGTLDASPGESADAPRSFVYDPRNPVPTVGGANLTISGGPQDQSAVEQRADVLLFTTPPLSTTVEIAGPVRAILYVSSDRLDTDFTTKLCDVYPDGRSMLVCDGILRARFRNSFADGELLAPGTVYEIEVDLWETAIAFAPGHRIRVSVSSSNFPRYDANPNTGAPFGSGGSSLVATNTVYCDALHPSRLVLPVTNAPGLGVAAAAGAGIGDVAFVFRGAGPNPFVERLRFELEMLRPVALGATVYDVRGRRVRTLTGRRLSWDGHDDDGHPAPAGVYFVRLEAAGTVRTVRATLLR